MSSEFWVHTLLRAMISLFAMKDICVVSKFIVSVAKTAPQHSPFVRRLPENGKWRMGEIAHHFIWAVSSITSRIAKRKNPTLSTLFIILVRKLELWNEKTANSMCVEKMRHSWLGDHQHWPIPFEAPCVQVKPAFLIRSHSIEVETRTWMYFDSRFILSYISKTFSDDENNKTMVMWPQRCERRETQNRGGNMDRKTTVPHHSYSYIHIIISTTYIGRKLKEK